MRSRQLVDLNYCERLRVWETKSGILGEWHVILDGKPIAVLSDPIDLEMFWISWRLTALTSDPALQASIYSTDFWLVAEDLGLIFQSVEFGIAVSAFPALDPFPEPGRIAMRGIHLSIEEPNLVDRIFLWARQLGRTKHG